MSATEQCTLSEMVITEYGEEDCITDIQIEERNQTVRLESRAVSEIESLQVKFHDTSVQQRALSYLESARNHFGS
jgi:hypothetical protein